MSLILRHKTGSEISGPGIIPGLSAMSQLSPTRFTVTAGDLSYLESLQIQLYGVKMLGNQDLR